MTNQLHLIPQLVLTGAGCSGKTESVKALKQKYPGTVEIVEEAASAAFTAFPRPKQWREGSPLRFQRMVLGMQLELEAEGQAQGAANNAELVVCDRGLIDGAGYMSESPDIFFSRFGMTAQEAYDRYRVVIHLQTLAALEDTSHYYACLGSNPTRWEPHDRAREIDHHIGKVWERHPRYHFIPANFDLPGILYKVDALVAGVLEELRAAAA